MAERSEFCTVGTIALLYLERRLSIIKTIVALSLLLYTSLYERYTETLLLR